MIFHFLPSCHMKYIVIVLLFIIAIVIWIYPQILIKARCRKLDEILNKLWGIVSYVQVVLYFLSYISDTKKQHLCLIYIQHGRSNGWKCNISSRVMRQRLSPHPAPPLTIHNPPVAIPVYASTLYNDKACTRNYDLKYTLPTSWFQFVKIIHLGKYCFVYLFLDQFWTFHCQTELETEWSTFLGLMLFLFLFFLSCSLNLKV